MARDDAGFPAFLASNDAELKVSAQLWPKIEYHTQREHSGYAEAETV